MLDHDLKLNKYDPAPHRLNRNNEMEFWDKDMEHWDLCDQNCTVEHCLKYNGCLVTYEDTWSEPYEGMLDD